MSEGRSERERERKEGQEREERSENVQVTSEELMAAYEKMTGILIGVMVLALKVPDQVPLAT